MSASSLISVFGFQTTPCIHRLQYAIEISELFCRYSFLICTCSTVYWTVARGLLRPTKWKHSTSSLQAILDGLTKHCRDIVSKEWLFELSFALAVGFDDSGDSAGSVKIANDCLALAKDLSRQFQVLHAISGAFCDACLFLTYIAY